MEVQSTPKKCPVCEETDLNQFGANKAKPDGLQIHCRRCKKAYQAKWYAKNKKRHIANAAVRRREVF